MSLTTSKSDISLFSILVRLMSTPSISLSGWELNPFTKTAVILIFFSYSVGRPKHERVMFTANEQERFIGSQAVSLGNRDNMNFFVNSFLIFLIGKI